MKIQDSPEPALQSPYPRFDRGPVLAQMRRYYGARNDRFGWIALAWEWSLIIGAAACARYFSHPLVWVLAWMLIATRQIGLFILVHEAAHYALFKTRSLNNFVANFLAAFPLGTSVQAYRQHHFTHHRFTNTDQDPDWVVLQGGDWSWPKSPLQACGVLLRDLSGWSFLKYAAAVKSHSPWSSFFKNSPLSRGERMLLVTQTVILIGSGFYFHVWKEIFLFWFFPMMTFYVMLARFRSLAEHHAIHHTHELNCTRTVLAPLWERFIIAPYGLNYHLEHHLFPQIPCRYLPEVHRILMQEEDFREKAHLVPSYFHSRGVLGELVKKRSSPALEELPSTPL